MSEKKVINLRAARKAKTRADKRRQGNENAAKFGQTRSDTRKQTAQKTIDIARLDGHKLDP